MVLSAQREPIDIQVTGESRTIGSSSAEKERGPGRGGNKAGEERENEAEGKKDQRRETDAGTKSGGSERDKGAV